MKFIKFVIVILFKNIREKERQILSMQGDLKALKIQLSDKECEIFLIKDKFQEDYDHVIKKHNANISLISKQVKKNF